MNKEQRRALFEQLRDAGGRYRIRDVVAVTEFRGTVGVEIPDVAISDQVDVAALTAGDEEPFYVTLKTAQSGVVSGNGMFYGDDEVNEMLRQTAEKRPTGGRGHLRDDEIDSALPANELHWVGVARVGEFNWGKAYVAPGDTRDWLRRLGATRSEVATSIFGFADELWWDEEQEAFRMQGFQLEYIDLASPERAGVPSLAGPVHITSEMRGNGGASEDTPSEENPMGEKLEIIRQMTAEDVKLLPDAVVQAVIAQSDQAKALSGLQKTLGELRSLLGLEDSANVVEHVKGLQAQIAEQRGATVKATITELVNDPDTGVKVESVKPMVLDMVTDQKPTTVDEAKAAYALVMARESVKAALKLAVITESGPPQRRPATPGEEKAVDQFFPVEGDAATE